MRFSIGEKSLPYVFEAARKKFPYFLRRLEKVSILFEAARKKIHYFEAARKKFASIIGQNIFLMWSVRLVLQFI